MLYILFSFITIHEVIRNTVVTMYEVRKVEYNSLKLLLYLCSYLLGCFEEKVDFLLKLLQCLYRCSTIFKIDVLQSEWLIYSVHGDSNKD